MGETSRRTPLIVALGAALLGVTLPVNEWTAAAVSGDGDLGANTVVAIRVIDLMSIAVGCWLLVCRERVAAAWRVGWFRDGGPALQRILWFGVALRIAVFVFLGPHNNDPHWRYIDFIIQSGRLPYSEELGLAFHPPLYYLLALPWALVGSVKTVQLFSLLLSVANLWMLYRLISRTRLLHDHRARCHALLFTAILPQFVLFGEFISNDTLAYAIGTLLAILFFRYIDRPTRRNLVILAVGLGAGLLTKGTFLTALPVAVGVVVLMAIVRRNPVAQVARDLVVVIALTGVLGCYKFVQNAVHLGTPVPTNDVLHQPWVEWQSGTYVGLESLVDVNVAKLIRYPTLSENTRHSLPLLYYGTFWYSYIKESNFTATRSAPLRIVPRAIYFFGIVPTLLMLLGCGVWIWRNKNVLAILRGPEEDAAVWLKGVVVILLLLGPVFVVTEWGLIHDVFSVFQSRLLFSAFITFAITLGWGFEAVCRNREKWATGLGLALFALYAIQLAYYAIEIGCVASAS